MATRLGGWVARWLARWLAGEVARWLGGWVAGWLGGRVAGRLEPPHLLPPTDRNTPSAHTSNAKGKL